MTGVLELVHDVAAVAIQRVDQIAGKRKLDQKELCLNLNNLEFQPAYLRGIVANLQVSGLMTEMQGRWVAASRAE